MATSTEQRPWQAEILDELGQAQLDGLIADTDTHAAVYIADDENASTRLLGTAESELAAIVIAEDKGAHLGGGESRVVKLDDLQAWSKARAAGDVPPAVEGPALAATVEDGKQEDLTPDPQPGEQAAAFDPSAYDREDLQIPKIDGQSIDRISIKFAGEIFLDRSEPSDVAVYNALRLGKDVALLVEAKCSSTAAKGATDRDGDLDVVVGTKGLKVHTLSKPAGADWVETV
jgi:hypothetical protein